MKRLVLLLLAVTAGCGTDGTVVAEVGSRTVRVAALQSYLEAVTGSPWQGVPEPVAVRLTDQFLDQEVVLEAVRQRRRVEVPVHPGDRSALIRSLLREACGDPPELDQAELDRVVAERMTETRPAQAHVRQMLLENVEQAKAARARLAAGEDFLALSQELSRAPNADAGGELGFLEQGTLPEPLDEVIFSLGAGEISPPVESASGVHIFQVLEVVPAGPPRRAEAEGRARRELTETQHRRFVRDCVTRLASEIGVELHEDHLWFRYEGRYLEKGGNDGPGTS